MATVETVKINIAGLERKIDNVSKATSRIEQEISQTGARIDKVSDDLNKVNKDLLELKNSFEEFINDNKKATALQKATTELIRVRQELERDFGSYKVVRDTMLGVLQATDLALVKKTTISQVSEELMLATPNYWLSPCLIAVSAWIGNDRDLADRAIKEAVRRDEEKTALTMALICRRNGRTDTCYEWLSIYFANQSAQHFTESNFSYLNAYLNGVFGPDEKHICDDYVAKWLKEIQGNTDNFEEKQTSIWREYCQDFTVDLEGQFPQMSECVHEFSDIDAYVKRINSVDKIEGHFSRIKNVEVDQEKLKKDIDKTLVKLVSSYDEKEEPLLKEEKYLFAVRYFEGDTKAAKQAIMEADKQMKEDTIDLIAQMTNVITKKEDAVPSEKKTAVSFLSSYIRSGFESYITEKKPAFPEKITVAIEGWEGVTDDGANQDALKQDFTRYMYQKRTEEMKKVQNDEPKMFKIAAIVLGVLGLILCFVMLPVGVIALIGAAACFYKSVTSVKNMAENTERINADYDERTQAGQKKIDEVVAEWKAAKNLVSDFESQGMRNIA